MLPPLVPRWPWHATLVPAMDCTGNGVQVGCRPIPESSGSAGLSLGSLREGKQRNGIFGLEIFGLAFTTIMTIWGELAVPQLIEGGSTSAKFHPRVLG